MKRRWLLYILIILFLWIFVGQLTAIEKLVMTIINSRWPWVVVAALIQCIFYYFYAAMYRSAFNTVDVDSHIRNLIPVIFASMFVNVAAPSGGTSGLAVFVDDASRHGASPVRATVGTLLAHAVHFATFLIILIPGLVVLVRRHNLRSYEVITAAILMVLVTLIISLLILGLRQPDRLRGILIFVQKWVIRITGKVKLKSPLSENWAESTSAEFTEASLAAATHPERLVGCVANGIMAHIIDLASLYALFMAFNQPITLGLLIAGFAMGILFWEIAITPQGIGVVEGVMALTFSSFGIPIERATVIAVTFRFLTFWLPFFAGFFILPRLRTFKSDRYSQGEFNVHLVALLTAAMGVINVIAAITPSMPQRIDLLHQISPLAVRQGSHLASVFAGFALIILAQGIWRRKQVVWVVTLAVLAISAISHVINHSRPEVIVIAVGLFIWVFYLRREFHALSDIPSMRQGLSAMIFSALFTLIYGSIGLFFLDRHFNVRFGLGDAVRQTITMFTQFYNPGLSPVTGFGRFFAGSIYFVGAVTFGYALTMLIRPVLLRKSASKEEIEKARQIIEKYALHRQVRNYLLSGKNYFFGEPESVIVYMVKGHVALVLSDPFGPAETIMDITLEFMNFCKKNDWEPTWINISNQNLTIYQKLNYLALEIGQDAFITTANFDLSKFTESELVCGFKTVENLGYSLEVLQPNTSVDNNIIHRLNQINDDWLTQNGRSDTHFARDWFQPDLLKTSMFPILRNPEGGLIAFCRITEDQLTAGTQNIEETNISIDLLRFSHDIKPEILDYLFVSLILWAKSQNYTTINLGFCPLTRINDTKEDPALERGLYYLMKIIKETYLFQDQFVQLSRYNPEWQPRYLVYPSIPALPSIALALLRVDTGANGPGYWQTKLTRHGSA